MTRPGAGRPRVGVRTVATAVVVALGSTLVPPAAAGDVPALETPLVDGPVDGWAGPPAVAAPWWVLVDAGTGQVLGEGRSQERRAVASTVKILTALTAASRTDLDEVVTVGEEVLDTVGANVQLQPGDQLTVEELLLALLVRSGNDAAEALAVHVGGDVEGFLELMRADAAALGLPVEAPDGVVLGSASGLGDVNELSAHDLAVLGRAALAEEQLRPLLVVTEATLPRVGTDDNRNLLVGDYPGATGIKTGFTEAAGNGLVGSARRDGWELVVVVLDAGDDPVRFEQATALLDHGFSAFRPTVAEGERTLLLAGGRRTLQVAPSPVVVPTDAAVEVLLPAPARADGAAGSRVGVGVVRVDGDELAEVEMTLEGVEPSPVEGAARIGRAAVDGIHAALRASVADAERAG